MKNLNYKKIAFTFSLIILVGLIVISIQGIFVSGPLRKQEQDEANIHKKIQKDQTCSQINRISFKFVTYTCEETKQYVIYDENAKKIATRKKSEAQFSKVKEIVNEYQKFKDAQIQVGYGYEAPAYYIAKDIDSLVIDFDTLEVIYSSGGK